MQGENRYFGSAKYPRNIHATMSIQDISEELLSALRVEIKDENILLFSIDWSHSIEYLVSSSFCWINSIKGADYWRDVYNCVVGERWVRDV